MESSDAAKSSRAAYLGHLVRIYNEVEPLMLSQSNKSTVSVLKEKIIEQYEKLKEAHRHCLSVCNSAEIQALEVSMERDANGKQEMLQRIDEWLAQKTPTPRIRSSTKSHSRSSVSISSSDRRREALAKQQLAEFLYSEP